jgi:hypothetical protein
MDIYLKVASRHYHLLRDKLPDDSPAHEAIETATPIEHTLDGVQFEGYNIPCDEVQARIILDTAKRCCPEIIHDIEQAIKIGRPR